MGDDRHRRRGSRDDRGRRPRGSRRDYDDDYDDDDRRPRRGARDDDYDDDYDADYDADYDDEEYERPRRRRAAAPPPRRRPPRRPAPRKQGFFSRLFGGGAPPPTRRGRGGRLDFGAVDDDYDDDYEERSPRPSRRRVRREAPPRKKRRRRQKPATLPELCTAIFGYAVVLPQDEADPHPEYLSFRQGVVSALQRLETEAKEHDIEVEDARECAYALALFMDEQVLTSKWNAREQWSREPLNIVLNQDPEGGVNFFRRMEGLRENQPAVKEVYLLCLALGFRGKYATEDVRVQTKKIGELKMKVLKDIQSTTMDTAERLFPEAYEEAAPVEDEVEPAPRWWWWASAGVVVAALLIWVLLFWFAGSSADPAVNSIRELAMNLTEIAAGPAGGA